MTIQRKQLTSDQPFTVFANTLLNDESLSAETLGVLVYLLSKPGNWRVLPGAVAKRFGCGRDKIYRIMNEMIAAGYAVRFQERGEDGAFTERNYLVSSEKEPLPENPQAAEPSAADPQQQKKDKKQTKDSPYDDEFEEQIWKPYPRKLNASKKKAWDLWRMLSPEKQQQVKDAIPIFAESMRREGRPEDKIKHLQFWISERIYETVRLPAASSTGVVPAKTYRDATRDDWTKILKLWLMTNDWRESWGPEPGKAGCAVPADMVAAHNVKHRGHLFSDEQLEVFRSQVCDAENAGRAAE